MTEHDHEEGVEKATLTRQLAAWTRLYAESRTLPVLLLLGLVLIGGATLFFLQFNMIEAIITGSSFPRWGYLTVSIAVLLLMMGLLIWLHPTAPGGRWLARFVYRKEGQVDVCRPISLPIWRQIILWIIIMIIILGSYPLMKSYLDAQVGGFYAMYLFQPVSAIQVGLIVLFQMFFFRVEAYWMSIFSFLYVGHAILLLLGIPLYFSEYTVSYDQQGIFSDIIPILLNIAVPFFGYMTLALLIGHFIGRIALRKVRRLAGEIAGSGPSLDEGGIT